MLYVIGFLLLVIIGLMFWLVYTMDKNEISKK